RSSRDEHLEWAKEVIDQQAGHLARMIDDLLDVSRITRGKIQLRLERQDLAPILQRAAESVRPVIEARRHELTVTLAPGPLGVEADATRLEQILTNLLTNAAKYTDEGGHIVLAARCEGHEHVITVGDDGVGIAPEMLPRVFEPFTQAEQTIDRSQGGLGIGLTLARHLAEMHGGGIAAASPGRGRGSEFTVRLPAVREPAAAPPPPRVEVPWAWAPAGARILLVDDNVQSAQGLASLLELAGYAVRSAFDGEDALVAARLHRPDVVLLDIGLPGMDGYQVAAQLRQDHDTRDALLIAITGYGHPEAVQRAHAAGFDHHLVKPLDLDALLGLIAAADRPAHSPYPLTG
ncbi:MAG TPA: ATP-binding protein, partial [Isosphaeraceae bacterium]